MSGPGRPPDVPVSGPVVRPPGRPPDVPGRPPAPNVTVYSGAPPGFKANPADTYKFGPPPGPAQKPLWAMNQQELQALAFTQAQAYYQPILDELHRQQRALEERNQGSKAGLQKLIEAVQGSARGLGDETGRGLGDAFAGIAGQAGQEQYLTLSQNEDQTLNDLLGQIMQVTGQIPGQANSILQDLNGQVDAHQNAVGAQANRDRSYDLQVARYRQGQAEYLTRTTGVLYVVGPKGNIVQATDQHGKSISTRGLTPYQAASLQQRAQTHADSLAKPSYTGSPYYADPVTGKPTLKPGYHTDPSTGQVVKDTKPKPSKLGSAPRRSAPGKWVKADGTPLTPAGSAYWEKLWRAGRTDGRGHVTAPRKAKASAGGGSGL